MLGRHEHSGYTEHLHSLHNLAQTATAHGDLLLLAATYDASGGDVLHPRHRVCIQKTKNLNSQWCTINPALIS
jgi:hypothetical protein